MALRDSVLEGFQVGQATGSGGTGVESFIKVLNDRIEGQNKFRAGVAQEVEAKRQTIPLELEKERQLLQEKNKLGVEASTSAIERFKTLQGTQGGFAPGSTMQFDPVTGETKFNIQLNPNLDQVETSSISSAAVLRPEVTKLKQQIQQAGDNVGLVEGPLSKYMPGMALEGAKRLPFSPGAKETIERSQQIKSLVNRLKMSGFVFGGKNLTAPEREIIIGLVDPTGKPKDNALQDLSIGENIMMLMEKYTKQGANADITFEDVLAEAQQAPPTPSGNESTGAASEAAVPAQPPKETSPGSSMDLRTQALQELQRRRARQGRR